MRAFSDVLGKTVEAAKVVGSEALKRGTQVVHRVKAELEKPVTIEGRRVKVVRLIAEGGYSFVYLVSDMNTREEFAMKRILTHDKDSYKLAMDEINLMKSLPPHPLLIQLVGVSIVKSVERQNEAEVFMLLELCSGGHLVEIITRRNGRKFSPDEILPIFHQVCLAVAHLHSQDPPIAHRDLKVENIIRHANGDYKLCDFGSCTTRARRYTTRSEMLEEEENIQKFSTMMYRAPEMCDLYRKQVLNEKVDIWALGCILYTMSFFFHPFDNAGPLAIINAQYKIPEFCSLPPYIIELIRLLLNPDPEQRPDCFYVLGRVEALMVQNNIAPLPIRTAIAVPSYADRIAASTSSHNVLPPSSSEPRCAERSTTPQPAAQAAAPAAPAVRVSTPTAPAAAAASASGSGAGGSRSATPTATPAGGGLFAMLDWIDASGTNQSPAPRSKTPSPAPPPAPVATSTTPAPTKTDSLQSAPSHASAAEKKSPAPAYDLFGSGAPTAAPPPAHAAPPVPSHAANQSMFDDLLSAPSTAPSAAASFLPPSAATTTAASSPSSDLLSAFAFVNVPTSASTSSWSIPNASSGPIPSSVPMNTHHAFGLTSPMPSRAAASPQPARVAMPPAMSTAPRTAALPYPMMPQASALQYQPQPNMLAYKYQPHVAMSSYPQPLPSHFPPQFMPSPNPSSSFAAQQFQKDAFRVSPSVASPSPPPANRTASPATNSDTSAKTLESLMESALGNLSLQ